MNAAIEIIRVQNGWIVRPSCAFGPMHTMATDRIQVASTREQLVEIVEKWAPASRLSSAAEGLDLKVTPEQAAAIRASFRNEAAKIELVAAERPD